MLLQAKLLPAVPAHAASFLGDRISLSAVFNGSKISITTHSNAYVGDLRKQVKCILASVHPPAPTRSTSVPGCCEPAAEQRPEPAGCRAPSSCISSFQQRLPRFGASVETCVHG